MKKTNARKIITHAVLLALWDVVQAQEEVAEAPNIMVTATRTEQAVEDVNASVEVIDRAQIESFSGDSVTEILESATGVDIAERGNETRVSLRGMNSDQTLILVDGLRRTDKASGSVITNIQVEDIERIEIVRGPMSALYGSDAMGGVINIITAKPEAGTRYGFDLTLGATDDNQRETAILGGYLNWNTGRAGHRLSFEGKNRGDYRTDEDNPDTDQREEERQSVAYRGRYALNDSDEVHWGIEYAEQDDEGVGLDTRGNPVDMIETEERHHLSLGYEALVAEGVAALDFGHGVSDSTSDKGTSNPDDTTSTKDEVQLQYTFWPTSAHTTNVGYGFVGEEFDSTAIAGSEDREVNSAFFQDQWAMLEQVDLTVGARYDDYSDFGNATSPNLSLAWRPGPWTLRAGYGEAFRAPTMMELYADYSLAQKDRIGNPDLDAETSRTVEAALARRFGRGNIELVVYRTEVDDLIQKYFVKPTPRRIESFQNIDSAEIDGIELSWRFRPAGTWQINGSVEYLDAEDADIGEPLDHRADLTAKLDGSVRFGPTTYRLRVNHTHDYLGNDGISSLDSYYSNFTSVDFRLDYQLSRQHGLFFGIDNLFDETVPDNMQAGGAPSDPGARYFYTGYRSRF
ncbi:TonB-dependent receptor plug domain-containing protein [Thiohalomonas denitrificans]|uniref:Outer membrane receptor for ferrienterochelin and colicins n=1 Tax=Thiohalomonas denitrificans TaxID=415747 RepID=A0A1G5QYY6_9GAMM|nr:TonB-dependent receptor [Thiohalomonas denitrificans]SCZ67023.1 outer membrane receptor for ferrienterochelin and colicins [Thiohalomonas denitrificans]